MHIQQYELDGEATRDFHNGVQGFIDAGFDIDPGRARAEVIMAGRLKGWLRIQIPVSKDGSEVKAACVLYGPKRWKVGRHIRVH